MNVKTLLRYLITGLLLAASVVLAVLLWRHYMYAPWTRDGRVRGDVITIASDVAGLVASVEVRDNQLVRKGDPLMRIDAERYRLSLEQAEARVEAGKAEANRLREEANRRSRVGTDIVSREGHELAEATALAAEARLRDAEAQRDLAALNLARTEIRSPVDGYITNLSVFPGDYAQAGVPRLAVIDMHSFWICGYFEETKLLRIRPGDPVEVTLLDGSPTFSGEVEGVARGIGERDNPTGGKLLADVNPTFNWVRLAQRIPVRIRITGTFPERLSLGMTCTVVIHPKEEATKPSASAGHPQ